MQRVGQLAGAVTRRRVAQHGVKGLGRGGRQRPGRPNAAAAAAAGGTARQQGQGERQAEQASPPRRHLAPARRATLARCDGSRAAPAGRCSARRGASPAAGTTGGRGGAPASGRRARRAPAPEHGAVRGARGAPPGEPPPGRAGPPRLPAGHPRVPQGRSPAPRGRGAGRAAGPGLPGLSQGFHPAAPGAAAGPAAFQGAGRGLRPASPRGRVTLSPGAVRGGGGSAPAGARLAPRRLGQNGAVRPLPVAALPPRGAERRGVTAGGAACTPPDFQYFAGTFAVRRQRPPVTEQRR